MSPYLDTAPYVGLKPTTPQNPAGCRMEPPVSEPRAPRASPAATAATEPPELPPGTRDVSCGFRVGPYAEFSVEAPIANSSILVRPNKTTPCCFNFCITVASYEAV